MDPGFFIFSFQLNGNPRQLCKYLHRNLTFYPMATYIASAESIGVRLKKPLKGVKRRVFLLYSVPDS